MARHGLSSGEQLHDFVSYLNRGGIGGRHGGGRSSVGVAQIDAASAGADTYPAISVEEPAEITGGAEGLTGRLWVADRAVTTFSGTIDLIAKAAAGLDARTPNFRENYRLQRGAIEAMLRSVATKSYVLGAAYGQRSTLQVETEIEIEGGQ